MLRLRPYAPSDAREIVKWAGSEYALRQWSADRFFGCPCPLTAQALNDYYSRCGNRPDHWQMTAVDEDGQPAGHLTMRCPDGSMDTIHFGFIIVDSGRRGCGYGRELLGLAIRFAFTCAGAKKITLTVFDNNLAARRCYRSCGFRPAQVQDAGEFACMGEIWRRIKMELRPEDLPGEMLSPGGGVRRNAQEDLI